MSSINITFESIRRQRTLSNVAATYVYAALLIAGPWIFIVIGLTGLSSASCPLSYGDACYDELPVFRSVVIYNSMISLILTSPLIFFCARYVSDELSANRFDNIFFTLLVVLAIFTAIMTATTVPFYLLTTTLDGPTKIASIQNATLLGCSWLLIPFLRAMQRHNIVLLAFGTGTFAMILTASIVRSPSSLSLLLVFNAGITLIDTILIATLVRQFGSSIKSDPGMLKSLTRFWELPAAGLAYAVGIWIDKIIMWHGAASGGLRVAGSLQTMPSYDTSMFWAQLASIPILAIFFVHVETRFSTLLKKFQGRLDQRASLRELRLTADALRLFVISNLLTLFVALAVVAATVILASFVFMNELGLRPGYMSIQRISLCAMVFHTVAMFCFMFLLYFDLRYQALLIVCAHLVFNTTLTLALLPAGATFYGYGNMLASALTLLLALILVSREMRWLIYHAFITNNTSL